MAAEVLPVSSDEGQLPRWFYPPPPDGWHAEDLDRLPPEAPRHIELIDGALIVTAPQKNFHTVVIHELHKQLEAQMIDGWEVVREMTVRLNGRQRPEPDLLVIDESALADLQRTWYYPAEVHMAIEVMSPESETRDTFRKPDLYAKAGIRHFWRVGNENDKAVVFTYELDPGSKAYGCTGIYRDTMKLTKPFPVEIQVGTLHIKTRFKFS